MTPVFAPLSVFADAAAANVQITQCVNATGPDCSIPEVPVTTTITTTFVSSGGSIASPLPAVPTPVSSSGQITEFHVYPYVDGAYVYWITANPAKTTVSWGDTKGLSSGEFDESTAQVTHVIRIQHLLPDTVYVLDLHTRTTAGAASSQTTIFTTNVQDNSTKEQPGPSTPSIATVEPEVSPQITTAVTMPDQQTTIVHISQSGTTTQIVRGENTPPNPVSNAQANQEKQNVITYRFIPASWVVPVRIYHLAQGIRYITNGRSNTFLTHDPTPEDPTIAVDLTGTVVYGLPICFALLMLITKLYTLFLF